MPTLVRAEMDTKSDRPGFKSSFSRPSRPTELFNTHPTVYKSRSALSSRSRRQRNSSGSSSLPPSPQVTALANTETPSTPSRPLKYPPSTPSVPSLGTSPFTFHTPPTPPKSQRSVAFFLIHHPDIYITVPQRVPRPSRFISRPPSPTLAMSVQVHSFIHFPHAMFRPKSSTTSPSPRTCIEALKDVTLKYLLTCNQDCDGCENCASPSALSQRACRDLRTRKYYDGLSAERVSLEPVDDPSTVCFLFLSFTLVRLFPPFTISPSTSIIQMMDPLQDNGNPRPHNLGPILPLQINHNV